MSIKASKNNIKSSQERLTSESLQSLYDLENGEKPEADRQLQSHR